jgi:hypothetical protein
MRNLCWVDDERRVDADRKLARRGQHRPAVGRGREGAAIFVHLGVAVRPQDEAGQHPLNERIALEHDLLAIRLRPEYPGHVWSYDFVEGRTHEGRKSRILSIID